MQHTHDDARSDGDRGVGLLAVRSDTLASIVDSDDDWTPLQVNASGALYVDIVDAEDLTVSFDGEYAEDSAHSDGDTGLLSLAVRNDTLGSLVDTDGDYAVLQVDANGALYEHLADISSVTGQGTKASSLPVTLASDEDTVPTEQQTPVQLEDSGNTTIDPRQQGTYGVEYTDVDQNTAATTTLYSPTNDAKAGGVHLNNPGSTAELRLEVTDGTNTAVLSDPGAGASISFTDEVFLSGGTDQLQVVVETAEGSAQSETAAVSRSEL